MMNDLSTSTKFLNNEHRSSITYERNRRRS
jgi:hypothetical protein